MHRRLVGRFIRHPAECETGWSGRVVCNESAKFKLIDCLFTWSCSHHFANFHFLTETASSRFRCAGRDGPFLEGKKGINSLVIVITGPFVPRFQFWRQRISGFRPLTTVFCFTSMVWPFDRQNGILIHFISTRFHEMRIGNVVKWVTRDATRWRVSGVDNVQTEGLVGLRDQDFQLFVWNQIKFI